MSELSVKPVEASPLSNQSLPPRSLTTSQKICMVALQAIAYLAIFAVELTLVHFGVTPLKWTMIGCILVTLVTTVVLAKIQGKLQEQRSLPFLTEYLKEGNLNPAILSAPEKQFLQMCANKSQEELIHLSIHSETEYERQFYRACLETEIVLFKFPRVLAVDDRNNAALQNDVARLSLLVDSKKEKPRNSEGFTRTLAADVDRTWLSGPRGQIEPSELRFVDSQPLLDPYEVRCVDDRPLCIQVDTMESDSQIMKQHILKYTDFLSRQGVDEKGLCLFQDSLTQGSIGWPLAGYSLPAVFTHNPSPLRSDPEAYPRTQKTECSYALNAKHQHVIKVSHQVILPLIGREDHGVCATLTYQVKQTFTCVDNEWNIKVEHEPSIVQFMQPMVADDCLETAQWGLTETREFLQRAQDGFNYALENAEEREIIEENLGSAQAELVDVELDAPAPRIADTAPNVVQEERILDLDGGFVPQEDEGSLDNLVEQAKASNFAFDDKRPT